MGMLMFRVLRWLGLVIIFAPVILTGLYIGLQDRDSLLLDILLLVSLVVGAIAGIYLIHYADLRIRYKYRDSISTCKQHKSVHRSCGC